MQTDNETANAQAPGTDIPAQGWQGRTALFLASQGLSLLGSMVVMYAIIWYVTLTTESGAALTIATLISFLPQLAISVFAGVWADRYNRKLLVIGADLLTAASTLVLVVLFTLGYRELWLLYLLAGVRSLGAGIQAPAVNALLPQLVPSRRLMKVNSINNTIQPIIMFTSPILSGLLLSLAQLERIFYLDIVTAVLAVGLLLALKAPPVPRAAGEMSKGYIGDLKAGLRYIRGNSPVRTTIIFASLLFFLSGPAFLTPLLVTRTYGPEVWRLTANEITFFAGSVISGFILSAWGGFKNKFRMIALAGAGWVVFFGLLGLAPNFYVYLALMTLAGFPMPVFSASSTTLLQEMTEPAMQGRVFGVQQLLMNASMPLAMLLFGPLADVISIELLLVITGVLMLIPSAWLYLYGEARCARGRLAPGCQPAQAEPEALAQG